VIAKEELITQQNVQLINVWKENQLEIVGTVYIVLQDGELILTNRTPLVHQHSLIALSVEGFVYLTHDSQGSVHLLHY
jgi:DNA-directed RNA polymerase-4 subunit 1